MAPIKFKPYHNFFCNFLILNNLPRMDSNHDKVIQSHLEQKTKFFPDFKGTLTALNAPTSLISKMVNRRLIGSRTYFAPGRARTCNTMIRSHLVHDGCAIVGTFPGFRAASLPVCPTGPSWSQLIEAKQLSFVLGT